MPLISYSSTRVMGWTLYIRGIPFARLVEGYPKVGMTESHTADTADLRPVICINRTTISTSGPGPRALIRVTAACVVLH